MPWQPWRPLDVTRPGEVAKAMRERAAKTNDTTTAGYLLLGADTIEHHMPKPRKKRRL